MKNAPLLPAPRIFTLLLSLFTALALVVISAQPAIAQTETILYSFCRPGCADGAGPDAGLLMDLSLIHISSTESKSAAW